jgi:anti-anti-sigma factor
MFRPCEIGEGIRMQVDGGMAATRASASAAAVSVVEAEPLESRPDGFGGVVSLRGEHDFATIDAIERAVTQTEENVLLDLSACEFIDSAVIGAILACVRELAHRGSRLELVAPPENTTVSHILDVAGLREILTVHERRPYEVPIDTDSCVW